MPRFDTIPQCDDVPPFDDIHHIGHFDSRDDRHTDAVDKLQFACPFSKRDYWNHEDCIDFKCGSYAHVIQHLKRRHNVTMYRCARCHEEWKEGDKTAQYKYDQHIRRALCEKATEPAGGWNKPVLSIEECKWTRLKTERKLDDREKWYWTWGKLFGANAPKPASPYYQSYWAISRSIFWAGFSHAWQIANAPPQLPSLREPKSRASMQMHGFLL